jgi:hypothetical protein
MFFKIALPACTLKARDYVYAPLNFMMFFRLLVRLHKIGYPAHWLSDVLTNFLNNRLHTTARYPRTSPLTIEESGKIHPHIHVDIAPFIPELSTLTAIWLAKLPFGISLALRIPHPSSIRRYTIRFTKIRDDHINRQPSVPALTLLFSRNDARTLACDQASHVVDFTLRKALMADDQGYAEAKFAKLRENCFMVTTWTWDREAKAASFWFDSNVMDRMRVRFPHWTVNILRTDLWDDVAATEALNSVLRV